MVAIEISWDDGIKHDSVKLSAEFTNWTPTTLPYVGGTRYMSTFKATPGEQFKYLIDSEWKLSSELPVSTDDIGNENHYVVESLLVPTHRGEAAAAAGPAVAANTASAPAGVEKPSETQGASGPLFDQEPKSGPEATTSKINPSSITATEAGLGSQPRTTTEPETPSKGTTELESATKGIKGEVNPLSKAKEDVKAKAEGKSGLESATEEAKGEIDPVNKAKTDIKSKAEEKTGLESEATDPVSKAKADAKSKAEAEVKEASATADKSVGKAKPADTTASDVKQKVGSTGPAGEHEGTASTSTPEVSGTSINEKAKEALPEKSLANDLSKEVPSKEKQAANGKSSPLEEKETGGGFCKCCIIS